MHHNVFFDRSRLMTIKFGGKRTHDRDPVRSASIVASFENGLNLYSLSASILFPLWDRGNLTDRQSSL